MLEKLESEEIMEFVDTHCHLHFENYPLDKQQALKDARAAGVAKIICVGTTIDDSRAAIDFASSHDNVWATVGVHPHEATVFAQSQKMQNEFVELLNTSSIVAIGEIGLDYYKNYASPQDQQTALKFQIEAGLKTGKPYIFHVREAYDDFWKIYDSYSGINGVVHSFSAAPEQLNQILKRGLYVGLNGIMTFSKDEAQLKAAKNVPNHKLLLETDAPFLTPFPERGKTCEPKHVLNIAQFLSKLRGEPIENLAKATTDNAYSLFGI